MKKIKSLVILLIFVVLFPLGVKANEKINVYLFRRNGCGFCESALEFFTSLGEDEEYKEYFNLVEKEVSSSKKNANAMESVAKELNVNLEGVPFIVIGKENFEGYTASWNDSIKAIIKKAYLNSDGSYQDVVKKYFESSDSKKDNGAAVTIVILLVAVAGLGFLIYMARDDSIEEKKESSENVEKPKEEVKKTAQVKATTTKGTAKAKTTQKKKTTTNKTKKTSSNSKKNKA